MSGNASCPEWMRFYIRARAQGAFNGAALDRDRNRGSSQIVPRPPRRNLER